MTTEPDSQWSFPSDLPPDSTGGAFYKHLDLVDTLLIFQQMRMSYDGAEDVLGKTHHTKEIYASSKNLSCTRMIKLMY